MARVREATGAERDLVLLLPGVSLVNTAMDDWNLQVSRTANTGISVVSNFLGGNYHRGRKIQTVTSLLLVKQGTESGSGQVVNSIVYQ